MEHVVFFPGPDGAPAFCRFASLDEAVRFVERLRNVEGVSEVSVHALTPVPLAFRPYYRVEVPAADGPAAAEVAAPAVPVDVAVEVPAPAVPVDDVLAPAVVEPLEMAEPQPVEPVAEPVAGPEPVAEPALVEAVAPAAEPTSNGKRSLGFFAH